MKVMITGVGAYSSMGNSSSEIFENLEKGFSGVRHYEEWSKLNGLNSHLGAPVFEYDKTVIPRQVRRSMSPMSEMAYLATVQALEEANLGITSSEVNTDRVLISMGSTTGSPQMLRDYFAKFIDRGGPAGQFATSFFKVMNHTVPANVALGLGFSGPMLSPSSACSTSSQSIALGYELIKAGVYDVVIAGGADELDCTSAAIFDVALAASTKFNNEPQKAPRPFDSDRDGLVVSEGAGVVILESEAHATQRGVKGLAEVMAGAYHCDGTHMSQPSVESMVHTMNRAIALSGIDKSAIGYVNAHATATQIGDMEEARAIAQVFGPEIKVSSLKGHFGHSLSACGALEVISCLEMMKNGKIIATKNLENPDPECMVVDLIKKNVDVNVEAVLSNNFAFGGMNTSLIVRRS